MRMRTINEASAYFLEQDPKTALTKTALRRLVVSGAVSSVKIGSKYLVALETIEEYLTRGTASSEPQLPGIIRKIEVKK